MRAADRAFSPVVVAARLLCMSIFIGWGLAQTWFHVTDWSLVDMDAYWDAATRLRTGGPLYPPLADESAANVYRYSPWFAAAWIPLTLLPKAAVGFAWSAVLVGATLAALRPIARVGPASLSALAFFGSILIWGASVGNVQPLLIAILVHGISARSGPAWIAVAASLKAVPILYVLLYVRARQWRRSVMTLLLAALLASPFLLFDLRHYPGGGDAPSPLLSASPLLYVAALVGMIGATLWWTGDRYRRLLAATTVLVALPRITLFDLPHLVVGAADVPASRSGEKSASRGVPPGHGAGGVETLP